MNPIKLTTYLKGGAFAGILAALVNNIWAAIAPNLGAASLPQLINFKSVTIASILPAIIASVGFWIGVKLFKKNGPMIFTLGALVLTAYSAIEQVRAAGFER